MMRDKLVYHRKLSDFETKETPTLPPLLDITVRLPLPRLLMDYYEHFVNQFSKLLGSNI